MSGFDFTESQLELQEGVRRLCEGFDADYWRQVDETGDFPEAFVSAMASGGWLGAAMPEALGGAGLGLTEAALVMLASPKADVNAQWGSYTPLMTAVQTQKWKIVHFLLSHAHTNVAAKTVWRANGAAHTMNVFQLFWLLHNDAMWRWWYRSAVQPPNALTNAFCIRRRWSPLRAAWLAAARPNHK
jgi:hypothetical protein